ncbi:MAG TPA: hypothetical protein VIY72_14490 [Acidimicrobiales bacterium]
MAAVLSPRIDLAPWNDPAERVRPPARPALRVLEGGRLERSLPVAPPARRGPLGAVVGGVVLAAVLALAALGAAHLLGADAAAPGPASTADAPHPVGVDASTSSAPAEVVAQPGDTLWAIAQRLQPEGDVRPLVDELASRAGGADIAAGDRIDVSGLGD